VVKFLYGAAFALVSGAAFAQDTVIWQDNVEGWSVAIDRTIADSCFIFSGFDNDVFLRFQFNTIQQNVQFIVANIQWESLENGRDYDLEVVFDEDETWSGMAKGHRWNDILPSLVLSVPMADQQASHFLKDFTGVGSVSISHEGSEIAKLALAGTEEAVASMMKCQASVSQESDARKSASDPFAVQADRI
jgi:hypothetical protein